MTHAPLDRPGYPVHCPHCAEVVMVESKHCTSLTCTWLKCICRSVIAPGGRHHHLKATSNCREDAGRIA